MCESKAHTCTYLAIKFLEKVAQLHNACGHTLQQHRVPQGGDLLLRGWVSGWVGGRMLIGEGKGTRHAARSMDGRIQSHTRGPGD